MTGTALSGAMDALALDARGITKGFAGVTALSNFDITVSSGEVHALLGENGSGKSTFIKVLSGYHVPDAGQVHVHGSPVVLGHPMRSYSAGCRFVHQDLGLVDASSILDNLFLNTGFPTRAGTIRKRAATQLAEAALSRVGLDLDPNRIVGELSPALKSGVAVARTLREDPEAPTRLLVLDEPTATMPDAEVRQLLDIIRRAASSGVGVLLVTHRLEEVFKVADRVTVLRDGISVGTHGVVDLDRRKLINLLVGREFEELAKKSDEVADQAAADHASVFEVSHVSAPGLDDISFQAAKGEIIGIAGIVGSGRESILGSLFGASERRGSVAVNGRPIPSMRPDVANRSGLAFLPADRKTLGGFMDLTVRENVTLTDLKPFWSRLNLSRKRETLAVSSLLRTMNVRASHDTEKLLSTYSGGNQQRILFAKWLRRAPSVFLLDEPTQGVDIAAKAALHLELLKAAENGAVIVVSSSDVDELAALCHRVIVMYAGRFAACLDKSECNVQEILMASMDASEGSAA